MATKREHAVAILDALESKSRLKSRTLIGVGIMGLFALLIAFFVRWQYAVGGALLVLLLLQITHERVTVAADAMIATGLEKLGWNVEALEDEASMKKLHELARRDEG